MKNVHFIQHSIREETLESSSDATRKFTFASSLAEMKASRVAAVEAQKACILFHCCCCCCSISAALWEPPKQASQLPGKTATSAPVPLRPTNLHSASQSTVIRLAKAIKIVGLSLPCLGGGARSYNSSFSGSNDLSRSPDRLALSGHKLSTTPRSRVYNAVKARLPLFLKHF